MNQGVLWYTDFADWSVISLCTEAIQTCVIFLVGTRSFTQYVIILWQIRILQKRRVFAQRVTYIVTKITSYVQSYMYLLKCFIAYLLPNCLKILKKSCQTTLILNLHIEWVTPPFRLSEYTITSRFKTASSIPCYNTQVNTAIIRKHRNVLGCITYQ